MPDPGLRVADLLSEDGPEVVKPLVPCPFWGWGYARTEATQAAVEALEAQEPPHPVR